MAYSNSTSARGNLPMAWINAIFANWKLAALRRNRYLTTLRLLEGMTDRELADINISRLSIRDVAYEAAFGKSR
jgi:uncharacterized protein YjiS (DUF1127 family)